MSTLILLLLITFACALFPQSAEAQNQTRYGSRLPRLKQIAARLPSDLPSVRNDVVAPASVESYQWSRSVPTGYRSSDGFPENVPNVASGSGYTWQGEPGMSPSQAGYAQVYSGGNSDAPSSPAMTQDDVAAARRAILSGDFFRWHGTQSSMSRNR
jgi:hypothetical protein